MHWSVPPQPSEIVPQTTPAQVFGVQQVLFGRHLSPVAQVSGHWSVPPQPSEIVPQTTPVQVFGVQHTLFG